MNNEQLNSFDADGDQSAHDEVAHLYGHDPYSHQSELDATNEQQG